LRVAFPSNNGWSIVAGSKDGKSVEIEMDAEEERPKLVIFGNVTIYFIEIRKRQIDLASEGFPVQEV